MKNVHLLDRDASQAQHTALELHDVRENQVIGPLEVEDIVLELVDPVIEIVQNRRVVIDNLVQYLVQQERGAALACDWGRAQKLFHVGDAAKVVVMIGDHIVTAEKAIQLD